MSLGSDNTAVLNFTGGTRELLGGDLTGDNVVNFGDYLRLATRYLENVDGPSDPDDLANLNGDGVVNFFDYLILNYFASAAPSPLLVISPQLFSFKIKSIYPSIALQTTNG